MSVPLSLAARLSRVAAVRAEIDAQGGGQLRIYDGAIPASPEAAPTGTLLALLYLTTPACGSVSEAAGLATLSLTPVTALAAAGGIASFGRLTNGLGAGVVDLPAGTDSSGAPMVLNALQLWQGGEVQLLSCIVDE